MPTELDNQSLEMDQDMGADPAMDQDMGADPAMDAGESGDQEGAMAKAELIKLANYATNLQEHIEDDEELEAWVQQKITIAATNIASVYHYLAYEKKIGEYGEQMNSPSLSESKKRMLKNWLMEAKSKVKELKKLDAEKKKVMEGPLNGGEQACGECGGTGVVHVPGKSLSSDGAEKIKKYKRLIHATRAAHNRMDNTDGSMSPESEVDEEFTDKSKVGDTFKTRTGVATKTDTGMKHKNTSYHDDGEAEEKSGKGIKTHAKAQSAAEKKDRAPAQKQSPKSAKTWGMKDGSKFDNRDKVDETKKTVKESMASHEKAHYHACKCAECYMEGNLEMAMHHKDMCEQHGGTVHMAQGQCHHSHPHINGGAMYECGGTMMYEAAPRGQKNQDSAIKVAQISKSKSPGANLTQSAEDALEKGNHKKIGQIHQYATTTTPTGRAKKVSEAKPSAGLSAAKKSSVVKDAKAGKDIGKPGKSFDKVAKSAGGGEKGQKIAAAAMWKNMKETTAYMMEKAKATKDLPGNQEKIDADHDGKIEKSDLAALRAGKKKETVKESTDFSRLQELTGRLNRSETPALVENREVDQIRALTKRLLG